MEVGEADKARAKDLVVGRDGGLEVVEVMYGVRVVFGGCTRV